MDGDLNLSQALGGLRIANPDNDALPSSQDIALEMKTAVPVRTSSTRATSRKPVDPASSQHRTPPAPSALAFSPPTSSSYLQQAASSEMTPFPVLEEQKPAYAHGRQPIPAEHTLMQHQRQQYRAPSGTSVLSDDQIVGRSYGSQNYGSSRPVSSVYPPLSSSVSPGASAGVNGGAYRLRSESSRSSMAAYPTRSDSRGGSAALQAGVPSHESSYTDRIYRQSQSGAVGNAPLPSRKSSRGVAATSINGLPAAAAAVAAAPAADTPPPTTAEEWQEHGATTVVRQEVDRNGQVVLKSTKKGVRDFAFGRTLGQGSYSTVLAATDRQTLQDYAVKVLDKRHIIKEKKVKYVNIERDTLNRLTNHPGIVRLYFTFQDEKSLYYVLDLAANGELLETLKHTKTFNVECVRFYGAQILDAIDYMHRQGVIHRDLKPENVLLDKEMHVKITDFGTAKILEKSRPRANSNGPYIPFTNDGKYEQNSDKANSFVGTAEYVSPELLTDKNACKASDLWAFGCIIFQLLAGRPPFKAANEYLTFKKIVALDYEFPRGFPPVAQDLVERLLVLDPAHRLSIEHIKNHEFFDGIIWGRELWRQTAPRLQPYVPPEEGANVINLNGYSSGAPEPNVPTVSSSQPQQTHTTPSRPHPRVITELPPPSQLDIDWSPVLTKSNERILKLGNLNVLSGPVSSSPEGNGVDGPRKFSRFFGNSHFKKRQRLVMVTSGARIIMAAAGGDEKKLKHEISLLDSGIICRLSKDSKGGTCWCIETRDKVFTFEDPKAPAMDQKSASQDWLDSIERAKDLAMTQIAAGGSYSGEDVFKELGSRSPASTLGGDSTFGNEGFLSSGSRLSKHNLDIDIGKGRKRFSKRHSKSGLAAVF